MWTGLIGNYVFIQKHTHIYIYIYIYVEQDVTLYYANIVTLYDAHMYQAFGGLGYNHQPAMAPIMVYVVASKRLHDGRGAGVFSSSANVRINSNARIRDNKSYKPLPTSLAGSIVGVALIELGTLCEVPTHSGIRMKNFFGPLSAMPPMLLQCMSLRWYQPGPHIA